MITRFERRSNLCEPVGDASVKRRFVTSIVNGGATFVGCLLKAGGMHIYVFFFFLFFIWQFAPFVSSLTFVFSESALSQLFGFISEAEKGGEFDKRVAYQHLVVNIDSRMSLRGKIVN